jgi:hypothetical protein
MAESFFLDPDEAKSMGDIDYMRTAKKVRKTFPGTKAWGSAFEQEVTVSAMKKLSNDEQKAAQPESFEILEEAKEEATARRKASNDLDMFRNMAKDIRKG